MEEKDPKILIVDDDDIIRETYVQIFQQRGLEVISAKDGVEGLDMATKEMPDAILTGIIMPRMDGFQLIRALQENVQTHDVPVAILSHLGREEDRKKAQELGVVNFIVQGTMTPNEVVDTVKSMTRKEGSYRLNFDSLALDAPRLAKALSKSNLNCPSCNEKLVIELSQKKEGSGWDAVIKCPSCSYTA